MEFKYNEYTASKGGTGISSFWGDMHIEDIRADKIIRTREDLIDVVDRFKADRAAFDVTNYNTGAKFIKANRHYESFVPAMRNFVVIVFKYQGKKYRTRTCRPFGVTSKIRAQADEIIEEYTEQVECLVSDVTGDVSAEQRVIRRLGKFDVLI